jgi:hypothetical protein
MRQSLRTLVLVAVASGALLLGESAAFAQQPYYGPAYGAPRGYYRAPSYGAPYAYGFHSHDGFFMRFNLGFGFLHASETFGGLTDTYSGFGPTFGAAFGGAVTRNLIIYGELLGTVVSDPDYRVSDGSASYALSGMDMTMAGLGPGVAYYFDPINLYVSGTLTFTQISFSDSSTDEPYSDTDVGVGLSLMVGKEWWVSRDWGLGLAGQMHFATMHDNPLGYSTRMGAAVFSLLFSATYN